ncbi:MAG TPA: acyl-CoA dehydrogenase family protein [Rhizomicrobium sp.]|jgi:alkylation response protein AidB-like acyl-CoA dehydrogenase|nr:acyl-CoA dehydrogenase family protein [Rhizomicrobium sp.]
MAMAEVRNMSDDELRADVRAWLAANWKNDLPPGQQWVTTPEHRAWMNKVVDARWAVNRWPVEWYGRGMSDEQAQIVEQEFRRAKAPGAGQDKSQLYAITLLTFGTDEAKSKILRGILTGEIAMCLLYSEPGAGSDLAGIRTRAERAGDEFVVNGQKVWTSGAATADYGMLIARTDWDKPKHGGISFIFLPMKQPGVEVRPLRQVTDESHFNEVFITDARAPVANLLGGLNNGWRVLQTALAYERSVMGDGARGARHTSAGSASNELLTLARESGKLNDAVTRQDLAQVLSYRRVNAINNARAKADLETGTSSSVMSLGKLAMSRILHEEARLRTALLGASSMLEGDAYPKSDDANFLSLNAYFTSIGGGTDQIQRNIIGERVMGLPKEPEVDRDIPFRDVRAG